MSNKKEKQKNFGLVFFFFAVNNCTRCSSPSIFLVFISTTLTLIILYYIYSSLFLKVFFFFIYIPSRFSFFLLLLPGTTTFIQIDVFFGLVIKICLYPPYTTSVLIQPRWYFFEEKKSRSMIFNCKYKAASNFEI